MLLLLLLQLLHSSLLLVQARFVNVIDHLAQSVIDAILSFYFGEDCVTFCLKFSYLTPARGQLLCVLVRAVQELLLVRCLPVCS